MSTKSQATTAKKKLATQLKDNSNCSGVGISKDGDSYVVAVRFTKAPTKKLLTSLTKLAGDVAVQSEVVGEVKALPAKKTVKKAAKKSKAKKATSPTNTNLSLLTLLDNAAVAINQARETLEVLRVSYPQLLV